MRSVVQLVETIKEKYGGSVPFQKICEDEGIIAVKAKLDDGVNGFYISSNNHKLIVLNANLTYQERRDQSFHELYHFYRSPSATNHHANKKEERAADIFAALCRAPVVREGDDITALMERYNVSRDLAKIRIEHETRKMNW